MSPEEKARLVIDQKLVQAGWTIQDFAQLNLSAAEGVAVREFPTSTGEVDYALFVDGIPVGVVEAKRAEKGEDITTVETQSARYANSRFKLLEEALNQMALFIQPPIYRPRIRNIALRRDHIAGAFVLKAVCAGGAAGRPAGMLPKPALRQ